MSRLIFGFDSSLTHFGYAVARLYGDTGVQWLACGVIVTKPNSDAATKTDDARARVEGIARELRALVERHGRPNVIAVEALALPLGKTSLVTVSALGRCRGLIDALAVEHGLTALEYQPQALKKIVVGDRSAEKSAVEQTLARTYRGLEQLLAQISRANREHAADAAAAVHAALTITTQHPPQEQ